MTEKLRSIGLKTAIIKTEKEINHLLRKIDSYFSPYPYEYKRKEGKVKNQQVFYPKEIKNNKDSIQVNNFLNRIVAASGYPNQVERGFLDKIISNNDNYDVCIHIEPFPLDFMLIQLNNELKKQRADMYSDSVKGIINPSLEIKYNSTRRALEELQKGSQKLF